MTLQAEIRHHILSASWRSRKASGLIQTGSKGLKLRSASVSEQEKRNVSVQGERERERERERTWRFLQLSVLFGPSVD